MPEYPVHHHDGDGDESVETLVSQSVLEQIVEHAIGEVDGAELLETRMGRLLQAGRRSAPAAPEEADPAPPGRPPAQRSQRLRHPTVRVEDGRVRAHVPLAVRYGKVLPDVAEQVQRRVAHQLEAMLDVPVDRVDVSVEALAGRPT
jgi:uncharacterized alkaline shock family protein YloU